MGELTYRTMVFGGLMSGREIHFCNFKCVANWALELSEKS